MRTVLFFLSTIFTGREPKLGLETAAEVREVREAPSEGDLADRPMGLPRIFKRAPTPLQAPLKNATFERGAFR
jgi:hypothetical protein